MKNISKEKVIALKLPPHTLAQQRRVLAELGTLQSKVDALKDLQVKTAAELDALLPSILDRAFKGDL
jgi:type I restriction enzyme S subunit